MSPAAPRGRFAFLYGRSARVMALAATGSTLQMVYQITWAWIFGSGREMDAFWAAFSVPTFLLAVLPAVLTPVGIPLLSQHGARDPARGRSLEEVLRGNLFLAGIALGLALLFLARPAASLLTGGMPLEWRRVATRLLRILACGLPVLFLMLAEAVVQSSRERFEQVYAAPLVGLATSATVLLALNRQVGIDALAWSALAGWAAMALALAPGGVRGWNLRIDFQSADFRTIMKRGLPLSAALAYLYCDVFVERIIASHLPPGSVTILAYTGKIVVSSGSVLGAGLVVTRFPEMSRVAGRGLAEFRFLMHKLLWRTFALGALGLVGLITLAPFLIPLVFEHGSFRGDAVRILGRALQLEGLVFFSGIVALPVIYGFYALHDTRTVSIIAAIGFTIGVGMKILGAWWGGVLGVAAAASVFQVSALISEFAIFQYLHHALWPSHEA